MFGRKAPVIAGMIRTRVKICGLTNEEDARAALAAGADALGFNFWPGSKRYVPPEMAVEWIARLPVDATRVAVAVDPVYADAIRWLETPGIDALQLHGAETPEFCARLVASGHRIIKAVRLENADTLTEALRFPGSIPLLLDAFCAGAPGGTGETVDWDLAANFVSTHPERRIILAGGLHSGNVTDAVRRVRPFGVDVASGVESPGFPRRKDLSRLSAFIDALLASDRALDPACLPVSRGLF
jgi:phosphoribosylanthranilate isomerase